MKKKLMSAMIAIIMLLSMIPSVALAETDAFEQAETPDLNQVVDAGGTRYYNGAGAQVEANQLGNNGSVVKVSKTIAPTGTENEFIVTLQVQTTQRIFEITSASPDAAVVLAFDVSNSMDNCLYCGKEESDDRHRKWCDYKSRVSEAKAAALGFLEEFANNTGAQGDDKRWMAILQFGSKANRELTWVDVSTEEGYSKAKSAIEHIEKDSSDTGGTNIEAALMLAKNMLNAARRANGDLYGVDYLYTVLLTDGNPTWYVGTDQSSTSSSSISGTRGGGDSTTENDVKDVGNEAAAIRSMTSLSKLYSICFGTDYASGQYTAVFDKKPPFGNWTNANPETTRSMTVGEWLAAFSDAAYNGSATNLFDSFNSIADRIALAAKAWKVTDTMGGNVSYIGTEPVYNKTNGAILNTVTVAADNSSFVWDILTSNYDDNITEITYDSDGSTIKSAVLGYTFKYKVKLNNLTEPYKAGTAETPANTKAELSYMVANADGSWPDSEGALKTGLFPVPSVKGFAGSLTFTKVSGNSNGPGLGGAEFALIHNADCCNGNWQDKATSEQETGTVSFSDIPSGHTYTLTETQAPDNYVKSSGEYTVIVSYGKVTVTKNEDEVYSSEGDTNFTVVNTPDKTSVTVKKEWVDDDDRDGIRPESVTVQLKKNDENYGDPIPLNEDNDWTHTWTELDAYSGSEEIEYTVDETEVPGYTKGISGNAANGFIITNTHEIEKTSVSGTKIWDDADNRDGKRPASITINLFADGEEVDSVTVKADENNEEAGNNNEWPWSFTDLPKFRDGGIEIVYSITEDEVANYTTAVTGNAASGFTVTNTHTPETTEVTGSKTWDDAENQDGKRPNSITIRLHADGEATDKIATVTAADNWAWSFTNLPKYKEGEQGKEIAYTITEDTVANYTTEIDGYDITNTHTPETTSVSGNKTWEDNNNQDGIRPASITIHLLADGDEIDSATVTADDSWAWSFTGLPKYANGQQINYSITEDAVEGYTTEITGYNVTNTHEPEKISISGSKTWVDNNNQDGKRPTQITVRLLKNGTAVDNQIVDADDNWAWSFTDLPKYEAGKEILYTIEEEPVEGYTASVRDYNITNTHTPETIDISGSKTWADADDQDGMRPESITVHLLADGKEAKSVTVTEADEWAWSFTGLPKYANGQQINYSITEDAVEGYIPTVTGSNITNTHTPATVEVEGSKTWDDNNNQDGKRPGSITINLFADGEEINEKTVTAADGWKWSFTNLPKYAAGAEITYTITEDEVEGYTTAVDGYNVTNTHTPETTEVEGSKTWDDKNDQDGKRPGSITINLLANGEVVRSKDVTEADGWEWEFTNLPKYNNGIEITYNINEESIDDYTTVIDGYDVTNTHNPGKTSVSGSKTWNDNNNQDGIRPASITIKLLADDEEVESRTVTAEDGWAWNFTNLPKYEAGKEILYTIEEDEVAGYTTTIEGSYITNTHTPETVEVSGSKIWDDNNDQDGLRPESITVNLLADGEKIDSVTVTAEDGWAWSFTDLPKFRDGGIDIVYTITEDAVTDYTTTVSGYDVTNTHTPETTEVTVKKVWDDADDQDGIRPDSVSVQLYANGTASGAAVVLNQNNGWTYTWTQLDKFAGGSAISYTVDEEEVPAGYSKSVAGDAASGFTVTNTHTPETTEVAVAKNWDDKDNQDGIRPGSIIIKLFDGEKQVDANTITADDDWVHTFTGLPKYKDGEEIVYTITEDEVEGYTTEITGSADKGYTVTNSYTPQVVSVSGSKTWDDADNQDGKRPESITVRLLADGKEVDSMTVTEEKGWAWSFTDLPKFASGKLINYTVAEDKVEGYETKIVDFNITNTHTPEITEVTVTKTWDDGDNYAGKRPDSITVNLLADGTEVKEATVTAENNWEYTFENLPKYANGKLIAYTVTEDAVDGYTTDVNGYNITNSYKYGELVINKVISGKRAKADDEFTLKLTLKAANALQPAALNNSIFAAVLANVDGAENIVFTRYNSAGEIVASEYKVYYPSQVNEYEFKLKGGEKMIVTQLPDELLKYTVTETVKLGYIDTYSNCEGETYIFGDPVEATVKNHKGGSSNNIVPPPQFGPPKTGDASVLGYSIMAVMAALGVMGSRRKK